MTRADFYLLEKQSTEALYPFAFRLLQKIHSTKQKVFVLMNQKNDASVFNEFLWTFADISFLPHCLVNDELAPHTPITIGEYSEINAAAPIILNFYHDSLTQLDGCSRVIEIIPDEANWRQNARKKYLDYKNNDFELFTHKITS